MEGETQMQETVRKMEAISGSRREAKVRSESEAGKSAFQKRKSH